MDAQTVTNVLTLNSGSSSLKFGLYQSGASATATLLEGEAEFTPGKAGKFHAQVPSDPSLRFDKASVSSTREALARIKALLDESKLAQPDAIGHRIVHGGSKLRAPCLIDSAALQDLEAAIPFAPLHVPTALSVIKLARRHFPGLPQVACFDTSFHADLPDVARVLPIDARWRSEGVQRYGFHGLSCEFILHQLGEIAPARVVIAHLGNGASITAVRDGRSIDTSMGLTPTGGLIMGTRSGDLDPGVLVYLAREKGLDAAQLEDLIDHSAGLVGISSLSSDMRRLHEAAGSNVDARLAIQMFCYSARKHLAAMIAALDGVDLIVFTGGIGENDAATRSEICGGLSWIGVALDEARNSAATNPISAPASRCAVLVLPSQEDAQIARCTWALLSPSRGRSTVREP